MLEILYIVAFTALSLFAVVNLIRSMISLAQNEGRSQYRYSNGRKLNKTRGDRLIHPEMLDNNGNLIDEPLLVIRAMGVEDARSRLDELYESSPGFDN
ncbi:DUF2973 domain-containing protein [Pseudanabaena sp. PCC 6802]|uniref:DUF2973 domain-containing protein n=1 Tax=Pseudanabaena sp. PCC 6802 TaxID=118173 RepID=UPI00034CEE9D|nr:DUF2973 domain-containing protein [Pseudanabaena sp. PCC 6802]